MPRNASAGSSDKVWLVQESLPYGSDADATVPMDVCEELPAAVGALLQKEDSLQNGAITETAVAETAVAETAVAETAVAETAVTETAVAETAVTETAVAETAVTETAVAETAVTETAVAETAVTEAAVTETTAKEATGVDVPMDDAHVEKPSPKKDPKECEEPKSPKALTGVLCNLKNNMM